MDNTIVQTRIAIPNPLRTLHMTNEGLLNPADKITFTRWRSLKLYNAYRVLIASLFLITQGAIQSSPSGKATLDFAETVTLSYFLFSIVSATLTWLEKPKLETSLTLQMLLDVFFIVMLMHLQPEQLGVGVLLVIAVASAGLISDSRLALFYAAIATIGILFQQTYSAIVLHALDKSYTGAVLLSLSCFATAWLAHSLAKRMQHSEEIASQRSMDVQNLAQINALITHEMQDGVLVIDKLLGVQHLNSQAQALLGLDDTFPRGKTLYTLSPEVCDMLREWQSSNKHDDPASNILKLSHQSKELRLRFLATGESRRDGAIIFVEDWSQMQTQAHQLKLAALGRLTANIAHEIRNPLSAISHANQLLQEDEEASPSTKRMLQIIADNVQRLDQIIKDVLELNRRDRTNQETIVLENFVSDFYHQFCAVEKIPDGCFELQNESDNNLIAFDRRHLNQILWNLCKNGWRHSKQQSGSLKLRIYGTPKLQTISIEISDDGPGIPENIRNHLFEPFFTTEKSGTGLGLYIARELADANGAKLQFKSSESGTQFFIHLKKA